MQNLTSLKKGDRIHHFNIIESGHQSDVIKICENVLDFQIQANPNYFYRHYETIFIEDARELIELHTRKNKSLEISVFVLECSNINVAAQNSLLKVFEEAHPGKYFFLIIPQTTNLLPTFLSRAVVFKNSTQRIIDQNNLEIFPDYETVLKMSIKKRQKLITKILDDLKNEKITKSQIKDFLKNIVSEMSAEILSGQTTKYHIIKNINQIYQYIDNQGSSTKSILEYCLIVI
jgi:DNA polymerase III delta prime subunit